ncbi:hypothetical protein KC315_g1006 [Hortaea werneckii]|nr:hypothetical protein KC315_g1006 [Hortaea werneckii]
MSSSAVAKKPEEQVAQPAAGQSMQASEQSASASASAGLNLNLVGAVTGLFSSKSKKNSLMAAQSSTRTNRHISKALALETCKHLERQTPSPKIDA